MGFSLIGSMRDEESCKISIAVHIGLCVTKSTWN